MISVTDDKNEALKAGCLALRDRAPHIAESSFDSFEVEALKDGPITIGMILKKGPELHVAIIPMYRGRWLSKRLIRQVIGGIIRKYGYVVTSVMNDNVTGQDFVERLGFKRQFYSNGIIFYRMVR